MDRVSDDTRLRSEELDYVLLAPSELSESLQKCFSAFSVRIDSKLDILLQRTSLLDTTPSRKLVALRQGSSSKLDYVPPFTPPAALDQGSNSKLDYSTPFTPHSVFINGSEKIEIASHRKPSTPKTRVSATVNESRLAFSQAKVPASVVIPESQLLSDCQISSELLESNAFFEGILEIAEEAVRKEKPSLKTASLISDRSEPLQLDVGMNNSTSLGFDQKVWLTLNDPSFNTLGHVYHYAMPMINIFSVVPAVMQTMVVPTRVVEGDTPLQYGIIAIEYCLEFMFLLDVITRFWASPRRKSFIADLYNVIDILALASLPVRLNFRSRPFDSAIALTAEEYILFCIVPILRLLACLRHFELLLLLFGALREASRALPVLLFLWGLFVFMLSALVYIAEFRSNIPSMPHAMWLVIVTWSTVGYGDVVPETGAGTMVIGMTIFAGMLYMAVPIGLISKIFGDMWNMRDRILYLKRLKKSLTLRNVHAVDVAKLFRQFDTDASGSLDIGEWEEMMTALQMRSRGQAADRHCGFHYFIVGDEMHVTAKRFIHILWPDVYHEVFGLKRKSMHHNRLRKELSATQKLADANEDPDEILHRDSLERDLPDKVSTASADAHRFRKRTMNNSTVSDLTGTTSPSM